MAGSSRRITVEFLGRDVSAGSTAAKVEQKFGKMGGRLDRIGQAAGKGLAVGLAVAGVAAVKMGQKASDLAETQSKANQIFGEEAAASLDKFAGAAAKNIGQSKQTALDAASTFGVFGKAAGLAGQDLVGFSTDMTTLASDMASFNNTSPEEAVEAIGAALRGEAEPIRKYGVLLDDATLRQEAMRMGLIKTTKEALTPQQKTLAAQAAIMKQTSDQQGDFARTSDGLANKQRIMTAQLENLGVKVGQLVVPALQKATDIGLKTVDWVSKNTTLVGVLVGVVAGLAAVMYTVSLGMRIAATATKVWSVVTKIAAAGQWLLNAALTANPIGIVIIAIVALVAAVVIAYKKSETFRKIVHAAFRAVVVAGKWLWSGLKAAFSGIKSGLVAVGQFAVNLKNRVVAGFNAVVAFIKGVPAKIRALGSKFADAGRAIMDRIIDGIKNAAGFIGGIASSVWNAVKGLVNGAIDRINGYLEFSIKVGPKSFYINPPDIPHLARGGITTGPTLAVVGDNPGGREAIIPLSGPNRRNIGGTTVIIQNPVIIGSTKAQVGRWLEEQLRAAERSTGRTILAPG